MSTRSNAPYEGRLPTQQEQVSGRVKSDTTQAPSTKPQPVRNETLNPSSVAGDGIHKN